ncbi:hypothetical protein A3Q56_07737 [Intoshia linei]|uniref:MAM domain-containing protein n=1 Tax=Intoshia linei TaxID=1819745 RepID=A0A177AT55_9BILA|nr:hypothetical protein A3Q56_07737 [Intoshia linei]
MKLVLLSIAFLYTCQAYTNVILHCPFTTSTCGRHSGNWHLSGDESLENVHHYVKTSDAIATLGYQPFKKNLYRDFSTVACAKLKYYSTNRNNTIMISIKQTEFPHHIQNSHVNDHSDSNWKTYESSFLTKVDEFIWIIITVMNKDGGYVAISNFSVSIGSCDSSNEYPPYLELEYPSISRRVKKKVNDIEKSEFSSIDTANSNTHDYNHQEIKYPEKDHTSSYKSNEGYPHDYDIYYPNESKKVNTNNHHNFHSESNSNGHFKYSHNYDNHFKLNNKTHERVYIDNPHTYQYSGSNNVHGYNNHDDENSIDSIKYRIHPGHHIHHHNDNENNRNNKYGMQNGYYDDHFRKNNHHDHYNNNNDFHYYSTDDDNIYKKNYHHKHQNNVHHYSDQSNHRGRYHNDDNNYKDHHHDYFHYNEPHSQSQGVYIDKQYKQPHYMVNQHSYRQPEMRHMTAYDYYMNLARLNYLYYELRLNYGQHLNFHHSDSHENRHGFNNDKTNRHHTHHSSFH